MSGAKKYEKQKNINIYRFYVPEHKNKMYRQIISHLIFSFQVFYNVLKNYKSFDIIFATSSRLGTAFLGFLISRIFNKKYALDIRDVFSDSVKSLNISKRLFGRFIVKFFELIEKRIVEKCNWLNFVSPGFLNYKHLNPSNKDVQLFTNGIDDVFINNRKLNKNKSMQLDSDKLLITYAGNIGYGQGLEKTVINIAKFYKNRIMFNLIGDGNSVSIIKKEINKLNLSNIVIRKPVKREELLNYYNYSDVLFLQLNDVPAYENVLPSKIFDYGSFDKPILAGVVGVAKEFLNDYISEPFIFDPKDYKTAIKEIDKILEINNLEINNNDFVKRFERTQIMENMISSFYRVLSD